MIYISGPMTGRPDFNYPVFNRVAARLAESGYDVLNPARHGTVASAADWAGFMRLALVDLAEADGIYALPGWADSPGASLEVHIADQLNMPVAGLLEWKRRARTTGARP